MLKRGLRELISSDFCEQPVISQLCGAQTRKLVPDNDCHVVNEFDYDTSTLLMGLCGMSFWRASL